MQITTLSLCYGPLTAAWLLLAGPVPAPTGGSVPLPLITVVEDHATAMFSTVEPGLAKPKGDGPAVRPAEAKDFAYVPKKGAHRGSVPAPVSGHRDANVLPLAKVRDVVKPLPPPPLHPVPLFPDLK